MGGGRIARNVYRLGILVGCLVVGLALVGMAARTVLRGGRLTGAVLIGGFGLLFVVMAGPRLVRQPRWNPSDDASPMDREWKAGHVNGRRDVDEDADVAGGGGGPSAGDDPVGEGGDGL